MKKVTIKLAMWDAVTSDHTRMIPVSGYYVPGTDDTIAVHRPMRWNHERKKKGTYVQDNRDWVCTHVPTGFSLCFTKRTRSAAIEHALKMHEAAKKHHVPLRSANRKLLSRRWGHALKECGVVARSI